MGCRVREEFFERDPLAANEKFTVGVKLTGECCHPWKRVSRASTLHFERDRFPPLMQDEIHFQVPIAPMFSLLGVAPPAPAKNASALEVDERGVHGVIAAAYNLLNVVSIYTQHEVVNG